MSNVIRRCSLAAALAGVLLVAACSGQSSSLSPTAPTGAADRGSAAGAAVSGTMGDPVEECPAVSGTLSDETPTEPCEPEPCDPTKESCEEPCDPTKETCECDPTKEECEETGVEGCTPGYWKNHLDSWPPTGYSTGQSLTSVFGANALAGTLLDGLSFRGGSSLDGAKGILLRAAVAGLLSASHPDMDYPRTPAQVIAQVTAALATDSRDAILGLAGGLDADNNLGCPLN